jgi:MSHA biogenesis protein MshI
VLEVPGDPARRRAAQALAIAAPHAPLRPLVEAADAAGAPWQALDIPETALRNLSALVEPPGRAQALLHVGAAGSRLVVTAGGELLLSRGLDARLEQLADAAAETDDEATAAARLQAFDAVGLELQRTLDGFDRLFSHLSLARLLVAPGAGLADFGAHLGELTFVPVQPLDLSAALDMSAVPELADPAALGPFLAPIGAALREAVP